MEVGLLYSSRTDSTLAACLLDEFCEVTLCCGTFDATDDSRRARETGRLAEEHLAVETGPSEAVATGDYEVESGR